MQLLDEATKRKQALTVTWGGLGINVTLAAIKFTCGILGRSQAVVAAAVHTLSDCATDVMILVGIPYWTAPADRGHPHGHRRIETVITAALASVLAVVALGIGYNALRTIRDPDLTIPEWIAFFAALLSVAGKEFLYQWTVRVGRRIKSTALIANAWHHRSDGFSSIPVALAVAGAHIGPQWALLDHIGAGIVALFILRAAWQIGWPSLTQLVDAGAPEKVSRVISDIVLATEGVERVHAIRTRYVGSGLQVDLHIWVDGHLPVRDGHRISEDVKRRLLEEGPDLVDVVVHLEPCDEQSKAKRILFLCARNSCRSQMAEAWTRRLKGDALKAYSAGVEPGGLDPRAVEVMREAGIDLSSRRSKSVDELRDVRFDYVITLCGSGESCPVLPGVPPAAHVPFDDPPALAANAKSEDEALGVYRRVRDEIRAFVETLPDALMRPATNT